MCSQCKEFPVDMPESDDLGPAPAPTEYKAPTRFTTAQPVEGEFVENCPKCHGRGRFVVGFKDCGPCFKCKGKGTITYSTSPEYRKAQAEGRERARVSKAQKLVADVAAWQAANREVWAWISQKSATFGFAKAMAEALYKFGGLTENQLATCQRLIAQDAERAAKREAEKQAKVANAPQIDVTQIETAFATATASGLKKPRLRLGEFEFFPAGPNSRNPGAIYVVDAADDLYLGKIMSGKFISSKDCNEILSSKIIATAADPKQAAVAHGMLTGNCSCCGRELTNPESVALGIGPICARKYGWA